MTGITGGKQCPHDLSIGVRMLFTPTTSAPNMLFGVKLQVCAQTVNEKCTSRIYSLPGEKSYATVPEYVEDYYEQRLSS